MNDTEHTGGPAWTRGKASGSYWPNAICEGPSIVATVIGDGYPLGQGWGPRAEATARLIAAAPDMLAALYKAQVSLCDAWSPRDKQALAAINAAIAKATGEETNA